MTRSFLLAVACGAALAQGGTSAPTADEIKAFYSLHEGTDMLPVSWLKALLVNGRPFYSQENLRRYGLIDDPSRPGHMIGVSGLTGCWVSIARVSCESADLQGHEDRVTEWRAEFIRRGDLQQRYVWTVAGAAGKSGCIYPVLPED
jgi:hypothetical protein